MASSALPDRIARSLNREAFPAMAAEWTTEPPTHKQHLPMMTCLRLRDLK